MENKLNFIGQSIEQPSLNLYCVESFRCEDCHKTNYVPRHSIIFQMQSGQNIEWHWHENDSLTNEEGDPRTTEDRDWIYEQLLEFTSQKRQSFLTLVAWHECNHGHFSE